MNWNTPLLQANTGDLYAVDNNMTNSCYSTTR